MFSLTRLVPIARVVGHASQEITLQAAAEFQSFARLGKRHEHVVHYVFGLAGIVQEQAR
jgi:hypothetical protein